MRNIIEKVKQKDNILLFLLILFISAGIGLSLEFSSNDEIWNFQNVYKMYNGFKIYEDINVIITPLFFWCAEFIFHIFGANLVIFRLSHCFLMSILFVYTYKLLKKLQIPKLISALVVFMLCFQVFFALIRTAFNYNNMALLFFVMGVYYLINEKTRKNILIQAIITILIFLTKQNMGIYYGIANVIYWIIANRELEKKIKENIKYISLVILGILFFIIYLLLDNNLYNFYNYTFGGLLEFAEENVLFDMNGMIYMISILIINIVLSAMFIKKEFFKKNQKDNVKILLIFSIMLSCVCYPIFNGMHIMIGMYLININIVYMVYILFHDFQTIICKVVKIVDVVVMLVMLSFSTYNMCMWGLNILNENYQYTWKDPFYGGLIEQNQYNKNLAVINYIRENDKNVIVFSHKAALYMIPLKRNNGDFDLPFKGNFGIKGEDGLIEKVDNMENTQFLISENEDEHIYQETVKVKEYIKNTKKYVGKIEEFEIYE